MSDSRDYIKRLEALNGGPLKNVPDPGKERDEIRRIVRKRVGQSQKTDKPVGETSGPSVEPVRYRRDLPQSQSKSRYHVDLSGPPVVLEKAVKGEEVSVTGWGKAYLITKNVSELQEIDCPLCDIFCESICCLDRKLPHTPMRALQPVLPDEVVFVDIETTGLGNSPLFLIGIMQWENEGLVVRQYLARDYAEEPAVTALFLEQAANKKLLVSFNGKSFDLPYIRTRAAANGIPFRLFASHLDLLHECRKTWRGMLPDYKLQTLEKHICGRLREGDIPGAEIPEAYHSYVRSSNAAQIVEILKHNMLDLVTLADLITRMPVR